MFTEASFTIAEIWKPPKCLRIDEWIKKMWGIYIYRCIIKRDIIKEHYSALKRNKIFPFATTWMG